MPTITISERTGADFAGLTECNMRSSAPTTNFGAGGTFESTEYFTGDYKHHIIRVVDNTGLSGVTVSGATLGVYCQDNNALTTQDFALHKVTAAVNLAQATWNERSSGNSWAVAGCFTVGQSDATDVNVTARATLSNVTTGSTQNFSGAGLDSDLTDLLNGTISELIYIMVRTDAVNDFNFAEFRGTTDTTNGPIFTVPYTAGGGSSAIGASNVRQSSNRRQFGIRR